MSLQLNHESSGVSVWTDGQFRFPAASNQQPLTAHHCSSQWGSPNTKEPTVFCSGAHFYLFSFFFYHAGFKPLDIGQFLGQKPTETSNEKKKNFWVCTMKTVWCATGVLALGVVWENNGSRVCEKVQTVSAVCAFFCLGCFSQCLWLLSRSHRQCHIIPSFQQRHTDLYGQSGAGQGNVRLWQYYDKKKRVNYTLVVVQNISVSYLKREKSISNNSVKRLAKTFV